MDEESIFQQAIEKASREERTAFLEEACAGDRELRSKVEALLRAHDNPDSFLERPIGGDRPTDAQDALTDPEGLPGAGSPPPDGISLDFLEPCDVPGRLGRIGPYEVIDVIGRGGMGVVLRSYDPKLSRVVAVKVLAPQFAANPTARRRFLREARAAAAVSHPHVVTIHAVEEADDTPYLVMECIDGQSLQDKIERVGTLRLEEILRIGSQIAAGLAAAHDQGLIHRDVKPGNILLENSVERVKITDFGLARAVDDIGITRTGEVAGTPEFMSPEQAQGLPVEHRSDLFSLGSVLYAMCTGRSPFRADTTVAVLRRVCDDVPRPIRQINPEIPEGLVAIINRLLAKNPDERFQTAEEVADLLGRHLAYLQHPTKAPPSAPLGEAPDGLPKAGPSDKPTRPLPGRSRRQLWSVVGLVLLAAVVGLSVTEATGVTQFAASVIRIVTGEGTLVVRVDDPDVSVTIDGQDIVITGAGPKEVRLKPGKYRLRADKDGKPVAIDQELVTITRGGRKVVNVRLVSAAAAAKTTKVEPPRQREPVPWKAILPADAPPPAVAPFDAATAKRHQQAWADYLGVPATWKNTLGIEFVLIPPGEFLMGSRQAEIDALATSGADELRKSGLHEILRRGFRNEGPQHRVRITRAFYLGVLEVTQQQYLQVTGTNPSSFVGDKEGSDEVKGTSANRRPVDNVSWLDAVSFCNKLSGLEKRQPCYAVDGEQVTVVEGTGYRLPTEAQWEYACRAGSPRRYCYGDSESKLDAYAWYKANAAETTHPVGEKLPNGFGLFDVHGNVWEWCQDRWGEEYYKDSPLDDPQGPSQGDDRVFRGGGWFFPALLSRAAFRSEHEPWYYSRSIGFRISRPLVVESSR